MAAPELVQFDGYRIALDFTSRKHSDSLDDQAFQSRAREILNACTSEMAFLVLKEALQGRLLSGPNTGTLPITQGPGGKVALRLLRPSDKQIEWTLPSHWAGRLLRGDAHCFVNDPKPEHKLQSLLYKRYPLDTAIEPPQLAWASPGQVLSLYARIDSIMLEVWSNRIASYCFRWDLRTSESPELRCIDPTIARKHLRLRAAAHLLCDDHLPALSSLLLSDDSKDEVTISLLKELIGKVRNRKCQ